jgi:16S rRNA (cytosine967-C5)-methyltransferase
MTSPARLEAFAVLTALDAGQQTLGDLLASPSRDALPPRERAFLHELVMGVLRQRGSLDQALRGATGRPLESVDPASLAALRLGAYQLFHLRVPSHAAVSETVGLAPDAHARGFLNAVLRRLSREGPPPEPDPVRAPLDWLTATGSLPRWLAERWLTRFGREGAVARARRLLTPADVHLRLNPRVADAAERCASAGVTLTPLPVGGAWRSSGSTVGALAREGLLYVQDASAQLVAQLATVRPGRVFDACAAPGGKALAIADALGSRGMVVAADSSPRRAATLASVVARWGESNIRVIQADAERPPFRSQAFACVLLDAPCSGLGTLRRNPDLRWRLRPEDLPRQAARQRRLLAATCRLVRPGGLLVYATCSAEAEETTEVIADFLAQHDDFTPAPMPAFARPFQRGPGILTDGDDQLVDWFFAAPLARR